MNLETYLDEHLKVFEEARKELNSIEAVGKLLRQRLEAGSKVLIAGNGGSAADCQHFAAELTGRFQRERKGLAGIALTTDTSAITAIANDYGYENVFARQLNAIGNSGDIFIGITTSGRSQSIINCFNLAREYNIHSVALTGSAVESNLADFHIKAPSLETAFIQEFHIFALHSMCRIIEAELQK